MHRRLFALLVGINNYPDPRHRLNGCVSDMEGWMSYLEAYAQKEGYEFQPLILRDEEATRQNVIAGFTNHLTQAKHGDVAVFFFAGHGSHIPGQEIFNQIPSERNQTLVCWDSRLDNCWDLVDKEISNLVADVAVYQPQITLILDCCHSGSGSRVQSPEEKNQELKKRELEPQPVKTRPKDSYFVSTRNSVIQGEINREFADRKTNEQDNIFRLKQGRHILLSACHEEQTAKEAYIQGEGPRGVFSYYLQQILAKATRQMTHAELLTQVRDRIQKHKIPEQAPQLEIIKGDNTDLQRFFLSQEIQGDVSGVFTLSYDGDWRVDAGHVHGWENLEATGGIELSIFSFGDKPENVKKGLDRLTTAYVKKVHSTFSQVYVDEPQMLDEQKLYKALLTKASISSSSLPTIFLEGDQAGVEALRRSLVRMDRRLVDAQEVGDASQAMVRLKAGDGEYQIFRGAILGEPLSVPMAVREYRCLEVPTDLSEPLMRIKRWVDLRNLTNTNLGNAIFSSLEFQLIQNQELYEGTDFRFECEYRDGRWLIPDIQFQIINRTSSPIYCAVLYLSPEFGIDSTLIEAGELKIGAYDMGQSIEFNLAVPEILVDQGINEYPTFFKLIASNQSFEARIWSQPGLEKVCREILPKKRKGELWLMQEITIRCDISDKQKNIFDEQVSSGIIKSEFQFQNNNQTIEIDELWAVNKFDLLAELGRLSERSPVVTERPLFKADNAQLPGNSISSSNNFFFTQGKKIFQDIVVQIVNITRVPEKIDNYKLVPTIANLSEYDKGQALVLLEKIITEVLNFDQEISSLAAVLIVECYDLNGLRLLFSEYLED